MPLRHVKYYWGKLRRMDWGGFSEAIDFAHRKSGKPKALIACDMVWCSWRYTAGYVDYNEWEFYSIGAKHRRTYITLGQSHRVAYTYNDPGVVGLFNDKSVFVDHFADFVHRDHLDLRRTDAAGLEEFVRAHGRVMAKRHNDYVGRGIDLIDLQASPNLDFDELYTALLANGQVLVEEFFTQHEQMSWLSPKSVNTLRIITFIDDAGEPHVLVRVLKVGLGEPLDNIGQGGMYTILDENGEITTPFIDKHGDHFEDHPISGNKLIGFRVPLFDQVIETAKRAALKEPGVRYVGWDIAVGPERPEIIEGNTTTGPFQVVPSLSPTKTGVRPEYAKYIDFLR